MTNGRDSTEIDTRSRILQVTRELIDGEGLDAVTLRAVGAKVGLSRAAAYRHFRDKEDLLAAIVYEDFEALLGEIEIRSSTGRPAREVVKDFLLALHDFGVEHRVHYQLMFVTPWGKDKFPKLKEIATSVFQRALGLVANLLQESEVQANRVLQRTAIIYAFVHGLTELHIAGHNENAKGLDNVETLVDELMNIVAS